MSTFDGIDPAIPDEDMVGMSPAQAALYQKHGTPTQFAAAVRRACDDLFCTDREGHAAIQKYRAEWEAARAGGV